MFKLGIRFLNFENKFNYRIALEIGLIIGLIVCSSAVITGLSNQFTILIESDYGVPTNYVVSESSTSFGSSQIPFAVYDQLNLTYINFKIPFLVKSLNSVNQRLNSVYYTNFPALLNSHTEFNLLSGTIPTNTSGYLIGKGLANELGLSNVFPQNLTLNYTNNTNVNIRLTGVFVDSGPWYFSLLGDLNYFGATHYNTSNISFIVVQLKNQVNLPSFRKELDSIKSVDSLSTKISLTELKQSNVLSNSFFVVILRLFNVLMAILFILMALKLIHSSITILHRLKNEFLINKILGMNNVGIQVIFLINLLVTGNIGVILGIFIGIALPQLMMLLINPIFPSHILYLIPNANDILISIVGANAIFIICSFFVYQLKLEDFRG